MAQLRQDYQRFVELNTDIIVVGPEDSESFQKFWGREALPFIGLPDPGHKVLKLYGQEVSLFKLGRMPAQMLIDKAGILRYVYYGHSMSDIPATKDVMALITP
jgi:peroxiredoxin